MTVGELKKLLENVPDELPLLNLATGYEIDYFEYEKDMGYVDIR